MAADLSRDIGGSLSSFVLSSTNPLTKNEGMVITRASPQTTTSFIPMDRVFNLDCKLDSESGVSFIGLLLVSE
jgi:hypothetical protein